MKVHHPAHSFSCSLPDSIYNAVVAKAAQEGLAKSQMIAVLIAKQLGFDVEALKAGFRKVSVPIPAATTQQLMDPRATSMPTSLEDLQAYPYRKISVYQWLLTPGATYMDTFDATGKLLKRGELVNPNKSHEIRNEIVRLRRTYGIGEQPLW